MPKLLGALSHPLPKLSWKIVHRRKSKRTKTVRMISTPSKISAFKLFSILIFQKVANMSFGCSRFAKFQPFMAWFSRFFGINFHQIAGLQDGVQGQEFAVYFYSGYMITYVRVDSVGKIN